MSIISILGKGIICLVCGAVLGCGNSNDVYAVNYNPTPKRVDLSDVGKGVVSCCRRLRGMAGGCYREVRGWYGAARGWWKSEDIYDSRFNPKREELRLPKIEADWKSWWRWWNRYASERRLASRSWWPSRIKPSKSGAYHASKHYSWNTKGLVHETDVYCSGKKMLALPTDPDREVVEEQLIITYYFQKGPPDNPDKWQFYHETADGKEVSEEEAMWMLKEWGLSHPLMDSEGAE